MGIRRGSVVLLCSAAIVALAPGCGMKQSFDTLSALNNGSTSGPGSSGGTAVPPSGPPAPPVSFQSTNCTLGYTAGAPAKGGKTPQYSSPLAVPFNESDVLVAFSPNMSVQVTAGLT